MPAPLKTYSFTLTLAGVTEITVEMADALYRRRLRRRERGSL